MPLDDKVIDFTTAQAMRGPRELRLRRETAEVIDIRHILGEPPLETDPEIEEWGGPRLLYMLAADPDPASYEGHIAWLRKIGPALFRMAFKGSLDEEGFEAVDNSIDEFLAAAGRLSVPFAVPTDDVIEKAAVRERVQALMDPIMMLQHWGEIAVDAGYVSQIEFDRTIAEAYAYLNGLEAFGK